MYQSDYAVLQHTCVRGALILSLLCLFADNSSSLLIALKSKFVQNSY